jgi:hypothetical protein
MELFEVLFELLGNSTSGIMFLSLVLLVGLIVLFLCL